MHNIFIIVRSIMLSEQSMQAWRTVGGLFPKRERNTLDILSYAANKQYQEQTNKVIILNMGNTYFRPTDQELLNCKIEPENVFNRGENIELLITPGKTRYLIGELLPPYPQQNDLPMDTWIKAPGSKGNGKEHKLLIETIPTIPKSWDIQKHINGTEYRVITVDDKIVQTFKRTDITGNRTYEWVGVTNTPSPIKQIAKTAAKKLQGRNIIGWDIMHTTNNAFILEGNTCPGMSIPTAQRITNFIQERNTYNDNIDI